MGGEVAGLLSLAVVAGALRFDNRGRHPRLMFPDFGWRDDMNKMMETVKSLQSRVKSLEEEVSRRREAPSPKFGSGGVFDWNEAKKLQFAVFSNISDVYTKVRQNRKDIDKKCPKSKCEKMLKKVKKVKASVEFIQTTNITELENLVVMLQNSPAGDILAELAPIKACMLDPTDSTCTEAFSGSTSLPSLLASSVESISNINGDLVDIVEDLSTKCSGDTCSSISVDVTALMTNHDALSSGLESVLSNQTSLSSSHDILAANLTSLQSDHQALSENLETLLSDHTTLSTAHAGLSTSLSSLQTDHEALLTNHNALSVSQAALSTSLTSLRTDHDALSTDFNSLLTNHNALSTCMQTPTSSSCTSDANGGAGSLPATLASAVSDLSGLDTSVASLSACMKTPTSSACTTTDFGSTDTLPNLLATTVSDLTTAKACLSDPSDSSCTTTYSSSSALPSVLDLKCSTSTCSSIQTDLDSLETSVSALNSCMQSPTDSSCTGEDIGGSDSLPDKVALLTTCMTTPDDSTCTINAVSTSLPLKVTNMDSCMTSIEDTSCTSSYGATSNYVSNAGSSLIGWVQQLRMPSVVQCTLGTTALTFASVATDDADGNKVTTDNCGVSKNYEQLTWSSCTQSDQPSSTGKFYHMEVNSDLDEVVINTPGTYKIEFTTLMQSTDQKLFRTEIFKITSKNPDSDCATVAEECDTLIQMRTNTNAMVNGDSLDPATAANTGERTTNAEGVFPLCKGDRILVIASKGGNPKTNNFATLLGDANGQRNFFTVEKMGFN